MLMVEWSWIDLPLLNVQYAMPSATTLTKNPRKTNKKAEARNQLEIDDETSLKTTIEKTKTGNSKITNNSNEPRRTLESKADNSLAKAIPAKSQKEHEGKNEAQNGMKSFSFSVTMVSSLITSALHAVSCCSVSLSWNVFFVFWLFIPFCASFFPSCSFWDLAGLYQRGD
jgi:uncharacterized membrane protein